MHRMASCGVGLLVLLSACGMLDRGSGLVPARGPDGIALSELAARFGLATRSDPVLGVHRMIGGGHRFALMAGTTLFTIDGDGYDLPFPPYYADGDLIVPASLEGRLRATLELPRPVAPPDRPRVVAAAAGVRLPPGWNQPARRRWRYIVIHHSATRSGSARRFDKVHRRKWRYGLGYHFVIGNGHGSPDGFIEVGPRWLRQNEGIHGAHAGSALYNRYGIGICLVGDFDEGVPTTRQMAALRTLVEALCRRYRIPKRNIRAHREVRPGGTHCPGARFPMARFLRSLRL